MELELRQEYINCWEPVYSTQVEQEEVSEMIVPDAYPDILEILDGEGSLFLQRKETMDGRAEAAGVIRTEVLYQSEEDNALCRLELTQPFFCGMDAASLTRRCNLQLTPCVQRVEIQVLNPRKVMVRTKYSLDLRAYSPERIRICPMAERADAYHVYQKTGLYRNCLNSVVAEKSFSCSDTLPLPGGLPALREILRTRGESSCHDSKLIGNKLVMKGEVALSLLYRAEDDSVRTARLSLPFSQILDAEEAGEDAFCTLQLVPMELRCSANEGEGRSVAVEAEILAQALISETVEQPMLLDLYSTDYELTALPASYDVAQVRERNAAQETMRELLETGIPAEQILDIRVMPTHPVQNREGGDWVLTTDTEVYVLFATEEGVQALHRRIPVVHRLPAVEGAACQWNCALYREVTATPSSGGVEVSFAIEFRWTILEARKLAGIEQATLEETKRRSRSEIPSVIIRGVQTGESLWDIAKSYAATEAEIMTTNALSSAEVYPGQMLLIPKSRERVTVE